MSLEPGMVVDGRYRLLERLGEGGMGVVFRAQDLQVDRFVALKTVIQGELDAEEFARFEREAQAAARLSTNPGFVTVHTWGQVHGAPYYVMEVVEGASLEERIRAGIALEDLVSLVEDVAKALDACHAERFVHRDLKPANVLVTREGRAKVADLGLVRAIGARALTQTGSLLGTPAYMAPEQLGDARNAGPAADVYSLGAILYHGLTGRPPYVGGPMAVAAQVSRGVVPEPPSRLVSDLPRAFDAVCAAAMASAPEARYPQAGALALDARLALEGEPLAFAGTGFPGLSSGARAGVLGAGALLVAVLATLGLLEVLRWGPARRAEASLASLTHWDGLGCSLEREGGHVLERWALGLGPGAAPGLGVLSQKLSELKAAQPDLPLGLQEPAVRLRRRWAACARLVAGGDSVRFEPQSATPTELSVEAELLFARGDAKASAAAIRACLRKEPGFLPARLQRLRTAALEDPRSVLRRTPSGSAIERAGVRQLLAVALRALYTKALSDLKNADGRDEASVASARERWGLSDQVVSEAKSQAFNAQVEAWTAALEDAPSQHLGRSLASLRAFAAPPSPRLTEAAHARGAACAKELLAGYWRQVSAGVGVAANEQLLTDVVRFQDVLLDLGGAPCLDLNPILYGRGIGPIRSAPLVVLLAGLRTDARVARGFSFREFGGALDEEDAAALPQGPSQAVEFMRLARALEGSQWEWGPALDVKRVEEWIAIGEGVFAPENRKDLGASYQAEVRVVLGRLRLRLAHATGRLDDPQLLERALAECREAYALDPHRGILTSLARVVVDAERGLRGLDGAIEAWRTASERARAKIASGDLAEDDGHYRVLAESLIGLSAELLVKGAREPALEALNEAMALAKGHTSGLRTECELRSYAAGILCDHRLFAESLRVLEPVLPRGVTIHHSVGVNAVRIYLAVGKPDEARSYVELLRETPWGINGVPRESLKQLGIIE